MQKNHLGRWMLLLLLSLNISQVLAQGFTASGSVKESQTGNPLRGVSVAVKGTKQVTTTDANGNFSI